MTDREITIKHINRNINTKFDAFAYGFAEYLGKGTVVIGILIGLWLLPDKQMTAPAETKTEQTP